MTLRSAPDPRVFTAFALLNCVGFDAESGWRYGSVREEMRLKLARSRERWCEELESREILEPALRACGALVLDTVLQLGAPPAFDAGPALRFRTAWQRESRSTLEALSGALCEFHADEELSVSWEQHLAAHKATAEELVECTSIAAEVVAGMLEEPGEAIEVIVVPNLLDMRGRGYSVSTDDRTWVFVGPSRGRRETRELVLHECLHRWLDPLAEVAAASRASDPMPALRARYPVVADSYPDLAILTAEVSVRAATAWLLVERGILAQSEARASAEAAERQGFLGAQSALDRLCSSSDEPREALRSLPSAVLTLLCGG